MGFPWNIVVHFPGSERLRQRRELLWMGREKSELVGSRKYLDTLYLSHFDRYFRQLEEPAGRVEAQSGLFIEPVSRHFAYFLFAGSCGFAKARFADRGCLHQSSGPTGCGAL